MAGKSPRWESELWSHLSSGNGIHCPFYSPCQARQRGDWCPDDNRERMEQLVNTKRFNLRNYDFIACGECGGIFKMVEMLAEKYLKRGRVHCPPVPTELFSLADKQRTIEARPLPLKAYHGAIWRLSDGWVIQLKDKDTFATKRFTLFHEAFHILAHCKTTPVFRQRGSERGSFNELLADYFAYCVLMPREWVKEKWLEIHDIDKMTEIFDVPKPSMCIRLRLMGLI